MKQIPLTQGKFALVDDDDYERLIQHKWYAHKCPNTYYAGRNVPDGTGKYRSLRMHQEIMSGPRVGPFTFEELTQLLTQR